MSPTPSQCRTELTTTDLAPKIHRALTTTDPVDPIFECGSAAIQLLASRPQEALRRAHDSLHVKPTRELSICWLRLYEDASLAIAAQLLDADAVRPPDDIDHTEPPRKRLRILRDGLDDTTDHRNLIAEVVAVLDRAIIVSGALGRRQLLEELLADIDHLLYVNVDAKSALREEHFSVVKPPALETEYAIERCAGPPTHERFHSYLWDHKVALIIPHLIDDWPARERWQSITYLLDRTLQGHRLVPVEVGSSYVDEDWTQRLISFSEFTSTYLLNPAPTEVGYLAQHDLFAQIPALRHDILTPDYCWMETPPADPDLPATPRLDEPQVNAWLGPAGTRTPLHTDPYHNLFCQVVGYKYVRVYAPTEAPNLYSRGMGGDGISMANTSQVDVSIFRPRNGEGVAGGDCVDEIKSIEHHDQSNEHKRSIADVGRLRKEQLSQFPLFANAKYQEAILEPGDCLYLPIGHWHYIESLTPSFSVSFWWK